jgi:hypothetical protein
MEYRKRERKLAPESYRWDSVVTLSELATICADGDRVRENQLRDTLRRLPWEKRFTLNQMDNGLASKVYLAVGLEWLRGQDYDLAPWQHTLADKAPSEPVKTALEPTVQVGEVEVAVVVTEPPKLGKAGNEWTLGEVERAYAEYKRLERLKTKDYASQTAEQMGVTKTKMNELFIRFGLRKIKKPNPWSPLTTGCHQKA